MALHLPIINMELMIPSVLQSEVQQFVLTILLGLVGLFALQAFSFFSQSSEKSKEGTEVSLRESCGMPYFSGLRQMSKSLEKNLFSAASSVQAEPTWVLRQELCGQVVRWLEPRSVAALGTASSMMQRQFWQSPDVWRQLSIDRGLDLDCGAVHVPRTGVSFADLGASAREAFRTGVFRIDGLRLRMLAAKCDRSEHAKALTEATRMMSGLMLRDGAAAIEGLCAAVVKILQEHDSGLSSSAETNLAAHDSGAVELFLQTARRRLDLLTSEQLHRLEVAACDSAARLDTLMEIAMRSFYAGLPNVRAELQDAYDVQPSEGASSPDEASAFWEMEYEAMHESDHEVRRREAVARMLEAEYDTMHEAEPYE